MGEAPDGLLAEASGLHGPGGDPIGPLPSLDFFPAYDASLFVHGVDYTGRSCQPQSSSFGDLSPELGQDHLHVHPGPGLHRRVP